MRHPIRATLVALLAALAIIAAACGDDDATPAASGDAVASSTTAAADAGGAAFPVTVTYQGVDTTIDARPEAIISLAPTTTEMLFAVGAGDQVVAADEYSDYPADAPTTDLSGFDPNLEAIVAHEPDLVVLSGDANDVVAGLAAVGVPTLVLPAATQLDDTYAEIELLGTATGHQTEAAKTVGTMKSDIADLVARVKPHTTPLTYYHELDDTLYTVTSQTFIGQIYALAGLENVADPADADGANGGYPQLSPEFLVDADPDLIFLADIKCCAQNASTLAQRPGFDAMTAVRSGAVVELDDDIASRWGPRVVDFLRSIVDATAKVESTA